MEIPNQRQMLLSKVRDVIWEEKLEEDANGDQIRLLSDTHFVQCRHHL